MAHAWRRTKDLLLIGTTLTTLWAARAAYYAQRLLDSEGFSYAREAAGSAVAMGERLAEDPLFRNGLLLYLKGKGMADREFGRELRHFRHYAALTAHHRSELEGDAENLYGALWPLTSVSGMPRPPLPRAP